MFAQKFDTETPPSRPDTVDLATGGLEALIRVLRRDSWSAAVLGGPVTRAEK